MAVLLTWCVHFATQPREEVPGACVNDEDIGSLTKRALLSGDRGRGGTRALNPDEADLLPGKQQGRGGGGGGPPAMHWLQDTVLRQRCRPYPWFRPISDFYPGQWVLSMIQKDNGSFWQLLA